MIVEIWTENCGTEPIRYEKATSIYLKGGVLVCIDYEENGTRFVDKYPVIKVSRIRRTE